MNKENSSVRFPRFEMNVRLAERKSARLQVRQWMGETILLCCAEDIGSGVREGAILILNRSTGVYSVFSNIYDAILSCNHAIHSIDGEGKNLLPSSIEMLGWLHGFTLSAKPDDVGDEKYTAKLAALRERLVRAREDRKVSAFNKSGKAETLFDSRGRFNPFSRSALFWSAQRDLSKRSSILHGIDGRIDHRVAVLSIMLNEVWAFRGNAYREANAISCHSAFCNPNADVNSKLKCGEKLRNLANTLRKPHVLPFRQIFRQCAGDIEVAAVQMWMRDEQGSDNAVRSLNRALMLLRLQLRVREIEEIRAFISLKLEHDSGLSDVQGKKVSDRITAINAWLVSHVKDRADDTDPFTVQMLISIELASETAHVGDFLACKESLKSATAAL